MRAILTPCINICKIDKHTKKCIGCKRTIQQIKDWITFSDKERLEIIETLKKENSNELGYFSRSPNG